MNNLREGYGIMKYASGNSYEGFWVGDMKHGKGVMSWRDIDEVYIGTWSNDKPHGYGEHIWGESTAKTIKKQTNNMYRGHFRNGRRTGHGTFFYMNGSSYCGEWNDDVKHGAGVFIHPDGKMEVGDYDTNRFISPSTPTTPGTKNTPEEEKNNAIQYHLHVEDIISTWPTTPEGGNSSLPPKRDSLEGDSTVSQQTHEIERLLLKYNSYLKIVYSRYNDLANRLRQREILTFPPVTDPSEGDNEGRLTRAIITARSFHKRLYCCSLLQITHFFRDISLLLLSPDGNKNNSSYFVTSYDISKQLLLMREYHDTKVIQIYQQLQQLTNNTENSTFPELKISRLLDDSLLSSPKESNYYREMAGEQPVLEHEFMELFVRVVLMNRLKMGYVGSTLQMVSLTLLFSVVIVG